MPQTTKDPDSVHRLALAAALRFIEVGPDRLLALVPFEANASLSEPLECRQNEATVNRVAGPVAWKRDTFCRASSFSRCRGSCTVLKALRVSDGIRPRENVTYSDRGPQMKIENK